MKHLLDKYLNYSHIEQETQHMYYCCSCHHKNARLSINYNKNAFKCWVCGFSGRSLLYLLYYLDGDFKDIEEAKKILGKKNLLKKDKTNLNKLQYEIKQKLNSNNKKDTNDIKVKTYWKSISDNVHSDIFIKRAYNYLRKKRGFSPYEIKLYNIIFDEETMSIVLPSYDMKGDLNYYITHYFDDGYYKNPKGYSRMNIIFNEYHIDFRQPVIITEGVYDAINIGYNCIPILGTFVPYPLISKLVKYDTPKVYLFLDGDGEAKESTLKISKYLSFYDVTNEIIDTPEGEDGNSLSRNIIENLIDNSKSLNFKNLIKSKINT